MDKITFINKLIYLFQNYYDLRYSDAEKLYNKVINYIQKNCLYYDNNTNTWEKLDNEIQMENFI